MINDELLALINDEIEVCEPECNQHQRINAPWLALRAVVELHKPYPTKKFGIICKECEIATFYPCPTIQTIEKELT